MNAEIRSKGTTVLPWVRGMRSLISAMMRRAASAAPFAASTEVPSVQWPCRSGGESCRMAASSGARRGANRAGGSGRAAGGRGRGEGRRAVRVQVVEPDALQVQPTRQRLDEGRRRGGRAVDEHAHTAPDAPDGGVGGGRG